MPAAGCTGWSYRPPLADSMEPGTFRALVEQHLLPRFSGAQLVPGHSSSGCSATPPYS
jgi:hypothetical protein